MNPGVSHSESTRQSERLAQLQEAGRLVRARSVDGAGQMHRVVRDHPDGPALDPGQRRHHPGREGRSELEDRAVVGQELERAVHVIDPAAVGWHDLPEQRLVRRTPFRQIALEVRQVTPGDVDRLLLVSGQDVDHPVRHLDRDGPDVLGRKHAQAAALDHRRAAHPDVRVRGGNDDVTTPEQCRVAGEATSGDDADERHLATERTKQREGGRVETRHRGRVGVPGTASATFCEQHDGELQPLDELEEAVLLLVVHLPLGAREHAVVVGDHRAARLFGREEVAVHPPESRDQPVRRGVRDQVVGAATGPLRRDDEAAVLLEAAGVAEILDVLPGRAPATRMATFGGLGSAGVERARRALPQLGQFRADDVAHVRLDLGGIGRRPRNAVGRPRTVRTAAGRHRSARHHPPRPRRSRRHRPGAPR